MRIFPYFPTRPDYTEVKVVKTDHTRTGNIEKVVSVTDMAEVDEKTEQLMEKIDGIFHCKACVYTSRNRIHMKEHVERHIDGLSYPCQFCDKTFRSRNSLRRHLYNFHK